MDAVIANCQHTAEQASRDIVAAVHTLDTMLTRLECLGAALRPALADAERAPLEEAVLRRAIRVMLDMWELQHQMFAISDQAQRCSRWGALARVEAEARQVELRVLAEARDVSSSQLASGVVRR